MRVIMLSTDRTIFRAASRAALRMRMYGEIFSEVHIVIFSTKNHHTPEKFALAHNVIAYGTNSLNRLLYLFGAIRISRAIIRTWRPSRITGLLKGKRFVISAQDPFETGLTGFLLAWFSRAPIQLQIHTDFFSDRFKSSSALNRLRVLLAALLLPHADSIRVVSDEIKEGLLRQFRLSEERIIVLPILVSKSESPTPVNLKKQYPRFKFFVLMAARLEREKNIETALHVFKVVVAHYPFAGLVIVGDGSEKSILTREAASLGLDNNVIFVPWQDSVESYYKSVHAFLQTSVYEGYGLALAEAGLCGVPLITSPVGVARTLSDGSNAFICNSNDVSCFARALMRLIEDNELRERLRLAGKSFFEAHLMSRRKYLIHYKAAIERAWEIHARGA